MSRENLTKDCKIVQVDNGHAAGQGTYTSAPVNMEGFDAVCFVYLLGAVTSGAVITLEALGSPTSGGSYTEIASQSVSATAGGSSSDTFIAIDTYFPGGSKGYNFVEAQLTIGSQNAAVLGAIAILYETKNKPVTPDASCLASLFGLGS